MKATGGICVEKLKCLLTGTASIVCVYVRMYCMQARKHIHMCICILGYLFEKYCFEYYIQSAEGILYFCRGTVDT